jgi:hypothetical protein
LIAAQSETLVFYYSYRHRRLVLEFPHPTQAGSIGLDSLTFFFPRQEKRSRDYCVFGLGNAVFAHGG